MDNQPEKIEGSVSHITFQNSGNGWTVLELKCEDDTVTAVGVMPDVRVGELLSLTGRYDVHPTFGPQFKVELCERSLPSTAAAILRYLANGAIKGVGPVIAQCIVERFGEESLTIMEKSPLRLSEIKGISPAKAAKIGEEYLRQFGVREVMLFLARYQIGGEEAHLIYHALGNNAVERIQENPYILCESNIGLSFERADVIATGLRVAADNYFRIGAGLCYVLRHNLGNGHTCIPRAKLLDIGAPLLALQPREVEAVLTHLIETKALFSRKAGENEFVFLPELHQAESYVAHRLALMLVRPLAAFAVSDADIAAAEAESGITYEEKQKRAILDAMNIGLLILTGGPGTGKTTTLNAMIRLMERQGLSILLAAPTGRAAKRMTELTGHEAKTIHRLLEVEWDLSGRLAFARNEQNTLKADVVIVDELSMVDVLLFESLLRALPTGCRLVLVGDADQLPSVGAGNVLQDLLDTGRLPAVRLTEVFRQALTSLIVRNAHCIVSGSIPELDIKDSDFFLLRSPSAQAALRTVTDLVVSRLPAAYNYNPLTDIQVLCPSRKRELGTISLNNLLQEQLNPAAKAKKQSARFGYILREGDKVMQVKNNYDIEWKREDDTEGRGVFNGDVGILEQISESGMTVRFDDRTAAYSDEDADQLELAYAATIHKSQGSEFECVVLPLLDSPDQLLYRNLLYTAVTRARRLLIIVGNERVVRRMVENNRKTLRYTALGEFLEEYVTGD